MSGFLESFVMKPYDLEKFMSEWHDAPKFKGKGRDDVDAWLAAIEQKCKECKVPSEYWPRVALSLMSSGARDRMEKLKEVLQAIQGNKKFRWNWKQFKPAVKGIEWKIGADELIKCTLKNGNIFSWKAKKSEKKSDMPPTPPATPPVTPKRQPPTRSNTSLFRRGSSDDATAPSSSPPSTPKKRDTSSARPTPTRKGSEGTWLHRKKSDESEARPIPKRSKTEVIPASTPPSSSSGFLTSFFAHAEPEPMEHIETKGVKSSKATESRSKEHKEHKSKEHKSEHKSKSQPTTEGNEVVEKVEVPVWLLNASTALDYLTGEHPKTIAVLSAILMGAGAVTANPALTAGSAVLGSHAAQTIGCVAMAIGQALNASLKKEQAQGEASSHSR